MLTNLVECEHFIVRDGSWIDEVEGSSDTPLGEIDSEWPEVVDDSEGVWNTEDLNMAVVRQFTPLMLIKDMVPWCTSIAWRPRYVRESLPRLGTGLSSSTRWSTPLPFILTLDEFIDGIIGLSSLTASRSTRFTFMRVSNTTLILA